MKFSNGIYAVGNFYKKRLQFRCMTDRCPLTNKSTDHLQTIRDAMLSFFPIAMRMFQRWNSRFNLC